MFGSRKHGQSDHSSNIKSVAAESTLAKTETHDKWVAEYRNFQNQQFYNLAFDRIAHIVKPRKDAITLDAGCGSATKAIHLAKRNFNVIAVDLADTILDKAKQAVCNANLESKIKIKQENITSLSFNDAYFDHVLCWGVLMHVPDVEKAINELCRVTKSGGYIIISEGNIYSLQSIIIRILKKIFGRGRARVVATDAGIEYWEKTPVGDLMTRQTKMKWLIKHFENNGAILCRRKAGQLSELYIMDLPRWIKKTIHSINKIWFKYIQLPGPAFANILIFRMK